MDHEAIRPLRALVEEAASTVEQAEVLTRRLNCTSAIWQSLSPPMTTAPWRAGLAAVRIVAYLARRGAVEVAEVAREAARVRIFATNLRCTVAMRRCEPCLRSAAKTLLMPCARAWSNALTSMQRDMITMEDDPFGPPLEPMDEDVDMTVSRDTSRSSLSSNVSEDVPELWEGDWEAIMAAETALSSTIALALAEGLKSCTLVDTLCETIRAQRGDATSSLANHRGEDEADSPYDFDEHPLYQPYSPGDLEAQVNAAHLLAGAAGAVGGCARRLLREVQRGIALVHAALDGFGIPGEHGHVHPLDASADTRRISIDGVCPTDR